MNRIETKIAGLYIFEPTIYPDYRGFLFEGYNLRTFTELGSPEIYVQDNHSFSKKGVLRGLHYQGAPDPQSKLVMCTSGKIFDVAVDIRPSSPTYLQWFGIELTGENGKQLLVPPGCLHGFYVLEDAVVRYKVDYFWNKAVEGSVIYNDPDLGVEWPLTGEPILAPKDASAQSFKDLVNPF